MGKRSIEVVTDEVSPGVPPPDERGGEAAAKHVAWDRAEGETEA